MELAYKNPATIILLGTHIRSNCCTDIHLSSVNRHYNTVHIVTEFLDLSLYS